MDILELIDKPAKVLMYQATYLRVLIDNLIFQIDFIDKCEFKLRKETVGQIRLFETHPLLIDYNERFVTTYINSKTATPEQVALEIKEAITSITLSWRSWTDYVTDKKINFTIENFLRNLACGTGRLLVAPPSITKAVVSVCDTHNIATKTFDNDPKPALYKLMTIANNYVIAKEFRLRQL
ncbi:MAG: hypothetical protein ABUL44_01410 [Flavobacterium sp.]